MYIIMYMHMYMQNATCYNHTLPACLIFDAKLFGHAKLRVGGVHKQHSVPHDDL